MAETTATKQTKGLYKHMCGVPPESCGGSMFGLSNSLRKTSNKVHNSSAEAMKCMKRYLVSQGFVQLSSREFRNPDGSGIRVLTKESRFGAKLRPGKAGRVMPAPPRTGG